MEQETEEEEALLEPEAEPELEPVPEVSREDRDVHSQNCRGRYGEVRMRHHRQEEAVSRTVNTTVMMSHQCHRGRDGLFITQALSHKVGQRSLNICDFTGIYWLQHGKCKTKKLQP